MEKEIRSKYLNRLLEITLLEYDWDGNGAMPISPVVISTVKDVLLKAPEEVLNFWNLFPDLNGTLLISAKNKHRRGLSIGEKEFSYVARYGDKRLCGKLPSNSEEIIKVLKGLKEMIPC